MKAFFLAGALASLLCLPARAADPESAPAASAPLAIGFDIYAGRADRAGQTMTDGYWAGSGPAYPSVGYARWAGAGGWSARAAAGVGRLSTGRDRTLDAPYEAWVQKESGAASVTVGKFLVPFGAQEWEFETKPGVMAQWSRSADTLAASVNQDRVTHRTNAYGRIGHTFGGALTLGLSAGVGRGLSYGTAFHRAWGMDADWTGGGWNLTGEYDALRDPAGTRFRFAFGKLSYDRLRGWTPFGAVYDWRDNGEELGSFHSVIVGANVPLTPQIALEGAWAATPDHRGSWLQLHWTWEQAVRR